MKYYRFGNAEGRFIGRIGDLEVYPEVLVKSGTHHQRAKAESSSTGGDLWFEYGPSTGGLVESTGFKFLTPGEMILSVVVDPGFKRRTLNVTGESVENALLTVERINGFHAASHSIAFASAVEDALDIPADANTVRSRIIMLELERIRSNLEVVKRLCESAGFGTPFSQIGYIREKVSRIISDSSGHRYFFGANGIGSVSISIGSVIQTLEKAVSEFSRIYAGLLQSKIFLNRLQNNGVAVSLDLVGPAARASGRRIDARLDSKNLDYSQLGFEPILHDEADSFGRFQIRSEEVFQSLSLIRTAADGISGTVLPSLTSGSGEGASRVESPQGDLFYLVRIEDGILREVSMLSPSVSNIRAFEESMKGNIFTDFHFNWESFGIWVSEVGVELR